MTIERYEDAPEPWSGTQQWLRSTIKDHEFDHVPYMATRHDWYCLGDRIIWSETLDHLPDWQGGCLHEESIDPYTMKDFINKTEAMQWLQGAEFIELGCTLWGTLKDQ